MTDTRRTEWVACVNAPWYPNLSHGGYIAYRIWKEFDGRRWFQRHEWKHADGTIEMDAWIDSLAGFDNCPVVVEKAA